MNRRTLLLFGLASLFPIVVLPAIAQTVKKLPRVVVILGGTESSASPFWESFLEGMRQAGQVRGQTVQIDFRYGEFSAVRALIRDSVAETPAVIVVGGLTATRYAREMTATVPIVVGTSSDLVDAGLVHSLPHPGGNITGISDLTDEIPSLDALPRINPSPICNSRGIKGAASLRSVNVLSAVNSDDAKNSLRPHARRIVQGAVLPGHGFAE